MYYSISQYIFVFILTQRYFRAKHSFPMQYIWTQLTPLRHHATIHYINNFITQSVFILVDLIIYNSQVHDLYILIYIYIDTNTVTPRLILVTQFTRRFHSQTLIYHYINTLSSHFLITQIWYILSQNLYWTTNIGSCSLYFNYTL